MAENSKIERTDHTFNPWIGCQHVSPGCDDCYAETMMDTRYGRVERGPHGERQRTSEAYWNQSLKWNNVARKFKRDHGRRPRVFCASLADVFDNKAPTEWRRDLFGSFGTVAEHLHELIDVLRKCARAQNERQSTKKSESLLHSALPNPVVAPWTCKVIGTRTDGIVKEVRDSRQIQRPLYVAHTAFSFA